MPSRTPRLTNADRTGHDAGDDPERLLDGRNAVDGRGNRQQQCTRDRDGDQPDRELGDGERPSREAGDGEPAQYAALAVRGDVHRQHDQAGGTDDDREVGRDVPVTTG